jgi:hypothetical protein
MTIVDERLEQIHENRGRCWRCGKRLLILDSQSPDPPIRQAQRPAATQKTARFFCVF